MAIVLSSKIENLSGKELYSHDAYYTGFTIFWAGLIVGMCDLICGVTVGVNGSGTALADAADGSLYARNRLPTAYSSLTNEAMQVRQDSGY